MNRDPRLVPRDALHGHRIAVSVSESADLLRLGLSNLHLQLTIAELSRAIVIAGGIVVYGGAIEQGFTKIVLEQTERFGNTASFEHIVPYSEHATHSRDDLLSYAATLSVKSTVQFMNSDGVPMSVHDLRAIHDDRGRPDMATALTAMRTHTTNIASARVVVGGKVSGFAGSMPGVAEEAAVTLRAGKPLYVAGGFGGAATLVGSVLTPDLYGWLPPGLPKDLTGKNRQAVEAALDLPLVADGLTQEERAMMAATHRPSDIATLVVLGLSRHLGASK